MTDPTNNFKAAARLVLQDLDPEVKAKRQEFMAGVPKCCLLLHLRKLKKFNRQVFKQSQFVAAQELAFSIKVTCQEQSKEQVLLFSSKKPKTETLREVNLNLFEEHKTSNYSAGETKVTGTETAK